MASPEPPYGKAGSDGSRSSTNHRCAEKRSRHRSCTVTLLVMVSEAVFIGGPSGVGKTSVAFEVHARLSAAAISHCLIDGDSLNMAYPPPREHGLAERNLAAMWGNYRALGYRRLIYANTASVLPDVIYTLIDAMGDTPTVFGVLLTCTQDCARARLSRREIGSTLDAHVASSADMASRLQRNAPDWVQRIPTDDRAVTDIAADVVNLTGWQHDLPVS